MHTAHSQRHTHTTCAWVCVVYTYTSKHTHTQPADGTDHQLVSVPANGAGTDRHSSITVRQWLSLATLCRTKSTKIEIQTQMHAYKNTRTLHHSHTYFPFSHIHATHTRSSFRHGPRCKNTSTSSHVDSQSSVDSAMACVPARPYHLPRSGSRRNTCRQHFDFFPLFD